MRSQEHLVADDHHRVNGRVYKLLKNTKEQMNTTLSGTTACYVGYPIYSSCEPQPCCQTSRQTLVAFHFQATCKIHAPSSKQEVNFKDGFSALDKIFLFQETTTKIFLLKDIAQLSIGLIPNKNFAELQLHVESFPTFTRLPGVTTMALFTTGFLPQGPCLMRVL